MPCELTYLHNNVNIILESRKKYILGGVIMADAYSVANSILRRSFDEDIDMTPMKLQKMVYFLYADYLYKTGRMLFDERFETWKYGPVLKSLYNGFKKYGANAIKEFACEEDGIAYAIAEKTSPEFKESLDKIWNKYKSYDGVFLSSITHRNGTAWWKAATKKEPYLNDMDIRQDINAYEC